VKKIIEAVRRLRHRPCNEDTSLATIVMLSAGGLTVSLWVMIFGELLLIAGWF
jgi:hypothetical protein